MFVLFRVAKLQRDRDHFKQKAEHEQEALAIVENEWNSIGADFDACVGQMNKHKVRLGAVYVVLPCEYSLY